MIKLTKISLLVLGVGALVVAFIALYLAYSQYTSRRDTLFTSIDAAQAKLTQISADRRTTEPNLAQLQQKISDLNSAYNQAAGQFPALPIQSIDYDNVLSDLADQSGLTLSSLTAADSTEQKEGNLTYVVTAFAVTVTGDRANILDFIHRVATSSYFGTASIDTLDLTEQIAPTPTPTPGAEEVPPPVNYSSVSITLTVYRYKGGQ